LPTTSSDRVTLTDIAADAGVSRATVSLVLRNVPVVAGTTRERVLDSMRRLGYVYHRGAANLRTQRTHAIGLIVTDMIRIDARDILPSSPDRLGGYQAMSQLLAERRQPTAALCFNDMVAMGALQALANNGKSPGEDFAIIGFDDVAEAALCRLALTTIATVPRKIGEASAELFLERISNPDRPTRRLIFSTRTPTFNPQTRNENFTKKAQRTPRSEWT
jgi:DNA-binding LacI/PurR family transcriptional regulator